MNPLGRPAQDDAHFPAAGGRSDERPAPARSGPAWGGRSALLRLAGVLALAGLVAGCSVQPWVKPYERERLADPIMQFSNHALSERHREHIHSVREAARGATGVQGGGCGCN